MKIQSQFNRSLIAKITFSLFIYLILFISNPTSGYLHAQEPYPSQPCQEQGCNEPWIDGSFPFTVNCNGNAVTATISYKYRLGSCGGQFQDIFITGIAIYNGWGYCFRLIDQKTMLELATEALLINNPMGFSLPINNGDCITNYRAQASACWSSSYWPFDPKIDHPLEHWYWLGCSGTTCCVTPYKICRRFGALIVSKNGPSVPTDTISCPPLPPTDWWIWDSGLRCFSICE